MVQDGAAPGHLQRDHAARIIDEWLAAIGDARSRQAGYGPDALRLIKDQGLGWDAMAFPLSSLPPALLAEGEALLQATATVLARLPEGSVLKALEDSLSHPLGSVQQAETTDTRSGATVDERLTVEYVDQLERERDNLVEAVAVLRASIAAAAGALNAASR